jgi:hypothetical protein
MGYPQRRASILGVCATKQAGGLLSGQLPEPSGMHTIEVVRPARYRDAARKPFGDQSCSFTGRILRRQSSLVYTCTTTK